MGSVVISVEVGSELGVEARDNGSSDERQDGMLDAWRRASYIFDRQEIPATWLVAGQVFASATLDQWAIQRDGEGTSRVNENEQVNESKHARSSPSRPGLPPGEERRSDGGPTRDRQPANQRPGDETDASPCVHPGPEDPAWTPHDSVGDWTQSARSVPDLIEGFQRSRVGHEIGCLPFSSVDIEESSQDDAATEVRATFDAAAELGVETDWLRSFAFPDGRVGHRDVLAAYGFESYPEPTPPPRSSGPMSSLATLFGLFARQVTRSGPSLVEPETDEYGMLVVPMSMALFPLGSRARTVARTGRKDSVADLAKRGVEKALEGDGVFHISVRLSNLRTRADFDRLATVVSHVANQRRETGATVETLGRMARRLGDHAATPPTPVR